MQYDFEELINRRDTGSYKWDIDSDVDVLPLWVADMDFRTAPAVREAVMKRAESGIFGYVKVPDSYYDALCNWFAGHHNWTIDRNRVIYTSGVVPAISAIIKAMVNPREGVIIQTPAYNCFFSSVRNNNAKIIENKLIRMETPEGFTYRIDFDDLRRKAEDPAVKMLILCNPQNPTGRVWTREELVLIREICRANGVQVVSDEIHCELIHPGYEYIPYATIDEQAIVCCSPSKAFNIAGLQIANIICPDRERQNKIDRAINQNEVCDVNPFGVVALQAAYNEGGEWLKSLNEYLFSNYNYLRKRLSESLPQIKICDSESTYLAWVDISKYGISSDELSSRLVEEQKVRLSSGSSYWGEGYMRINYACPRKRLEEGLARIIALCRSLG